MVLDHMVDPHNLGAIARSSLAAGLTGLVVSNRRAAPFSAVAFKSAAGALETLPVAIVSSIADALSRLNKAGVWSIGLAAGSTTPLFGLALLAEPVALVVGEEGSGYPGWCWSAASWSLRYRSARALKASTPR